MSVGGYEDEDVELLNCEEMGDVYIWRRYGPPV
jgi:hypothetical protein